MGTSRQPLECLDAIPCLPLLALAVWSRIWIGWLSVIPIAAVCIWIWLNPRVFVKPVTTKHWASRAVLGERVYLAHPEAEIPAHHKRAIRVLNVIAFAGVVLAIYGIIAFDVTLAVVGTLVTMIGKSWFLDRMVWLYQDLAADNETYRRWLY